MAALLYLVLIVVFVVLVKFRTVFISFLDSLVGPIMLALLYILDPLTKWAQKRFRQRPKRWLLATGLRLQAKVLRPLVRRSVERRHSRLNWRWFKAVLNAPVGQQREILRDPRMPGTFPPESLVPELAPELEPEQISTTDFVMECLRYPRDTNFMVSLYSYSLICLSIIHVIFF